MSADTTTASPRRTPVLGRVIVSCLAVISMALLLTACLSVSTDEHEAPGENITTDSGLDIADLRVASFQDAPYPAGADAQVLARFVMEGEADRLTSASSEAADSAILIGEDGAVAAELIVPENGVLALTPDGPHVLLRGLREPLAEGDHIPVTLTFRRAGEITAEIPRRVDNDGVYPRNP